MGIDQILGGIVVIDVSQHPGETHREQGEDDKECDKGYPKDPSPAKAHPIAP